MLYRPDGKPLSQIRTLDLACLEGCFTWSGLLPADAHQFFVSEACAQHRRIGPFAQLTLRRHVAGKRFNGITLKAPAGLVDSR